MYQCPVPNCPEPLISDILTKNHCERHHGMSKKEVEATYGVAIWLPVTHNILNKNMANYVAHGKLNNQYSFESKVREERQARAKDRSSLNAI